MYTSFYNLTGKPFQLSPDHRFFFGSRSHKKAMAYLTYGLNEREGFIVITGEIGAGKTTIVGHLLSQLDKDQYISAKMVTTQVEADDALRMVASAFRLPFEGANKATMLRSIEAFLTECHRQGKHPLLVIDEVQNMPVSALEELRMLSNFQLGNKPLLQCFLLGQPQFRSILASDAMEQLRQRVIASCHLKPLDPDETRDYIEHRLSLVGWNNDPSFAESSFTLIHKYTGGVPRRINSLTTRLLLFGYLEDTHHIDEDVVMEVVREMADEGGQPSVEEYEPPPLTPSPLPPRPARPAAPQQQTYAPPPRQSAPAPAAPQWQPSRAPSGGETQSYDDSLNDLAKRVAALKGQG